MPWNWVLVLGREAASNGNSPTKAAISPSNYLSACERSSPVGCSEYWPSVDVLLLASCWKRAVFSKTLASTCALRLSFSSISFMRCLAWSSSRSLCKTNAVLPPTYCRNVCTSQRVVCSLSRSSATTFKPCSSSWNNKKWYKTAACIAWTKSSNKFVNVFYVRTI